MKSSSSKCCGCSHDSHHDHEEFNFKKELPALALVTSLFSVGIIFENQLHNSFFCMGEYALFIPAYLISGWNVLKSAGRNILRGQIFDENFLMTVATLGAFAIHKFPEAVGVMLFFKIGELFQEYAVGRSRKSIRSLLEIRPDYANLFVNENTEKVPPESVKIGEIILVKPGEKIPLDGEILEGNAQIDTSALTGESIPKAVKFGDSVLAGTINKTGLLKLRVTKPFSESSINRILELVENAGIKKAPTEKFISKFARYYTPFVVFSSLAVALIPPLIVAGATTQEWIYRALVVLVISCPCGLVISIPLGYFGGIGGAAKRGILIKGSTYLDTLTQVKIVVFDKTGTLTKGVFKVNQIVPKNNFTENGILSLAAKVEAYSHHPIAQSIREAFNEQIETSDVTDYQEIAGGGVCAKIDGKTVIAGNERLLYQKGIETDNTQLEGTAVHLGVNGAYAGYILIADELKADALQAIQTLKSLGIEKTVMLTGDNEKIAEFIAAKLGLDSYQAELLPEGKVSAIEDLMQKRPKSSKIAFVGDGINDAPVIARADVGIAMGALGSDAAIETADVVLMTDAPSKVAEAIQIAKKTHRIVWQNIILAMSIKGLFIVLGTFGIATMWEAVFGDVGVALLAICNATRALNVKDE